MGWGLRIDHSTIITGDFNSPLLIMEGITREKTNKEIEEYYKPTIPKRYT